jgi:hypothetical protein
MKNIFYIPFLILMAFIYTRLSENLEVHFGDSSKIERRKPANLKMEQLEECLDLPAKFNKNSVSKQCN